jgi:hypothetical protein
VLLVDSARRKLLLFRRPGGKFASPFRAVGTREAGCRSTGWFGSIWLSEFGTRLEYFACFLTGCHRFDCIQRIQHQRPQDFAALGPLENQPSHVFPSAFVKFWHGFSTASNLLFRAQ